MPMVNYMIVEPELAYMTILTLLGCGGFTSQPAAHCLGA